jgi:serine/threonine protein kinase
MAQLSELAQLSPLGSPGGFKKTFFGRWRNQDVAVQAHFRHLSERYPREVEAMRRVQSPNVAALLEETSVRIAGQTVPVFICEYVEGRTLGDMLGNGPLAVAHVIKLGRDLLNGLIAIHEQKLIHRDVKPDNIAVRTSGTAVLLDLGVAKHVDKTSLTLSGRQPGTPGWMSPEQYTGDVPVDLRTDLFSLGLVLGLAATGDHPFVGSNGHEMQESIASGKRRRLNIPEPALVTFIETLIEQKPFNRPRTTRDALFALTHEEESNALIPASEA